MEGGNIIFVRESLVFDEEGNFSWIVIDIVKVVVLCFVELNLFYIDIVYEVFGKKIVYMVYNEFSIGFNNQVIDIEYREQMKQIFVWFKGQLFDVFILDLCYNFGGYLSCVIDLGSYLVFVVDLGKVFCIILYNDISDL